LAEAEVIQPLASGNLFVQQALIGGKSMKAKIGKIVGVAILALCLVGVTGVAMASSADEEEGYSPMFEYRLNQAAGDMGFQAGNIKWEYNSLAGQDIMAVYNTAGASVENISARATWLTCRLCPTGDYWPTCLIGCGWTTRWGYTCRFGDTCQLCILLEG